MTLSELTKKGFTVGKGFEGNLGKKYLKDWANQELTEVLPLGQQKIVQKKENESKCTNSSSVNKHLNS